MMMSELRYARVERERRFLLRELPPGLSVTDNHTQIFDNYITGTRLHLSKVRVPATRQWTCKLTQKFSPDASDLSRAVITDTYLTQYEYEVLSIFEGNEIRKNRYPYEYDGRSFAVDVYLGDLRALILAGVKFETDEEMAGFEPPPFTVLEVTHGEMFTGARLVNLTSDEIRKALAARASATG